MKGSGLLIGFGMGGALDFLLLHLVLQWHHMISARVPPTSVEALRENIFWDGVGLGVMWIVILVGVLVLFRTVRYSKSLPSNFPSPMAFLGYLVIGWGMFNLFDALLLHHLLGLHNVRDDIADPRMWNLGFLLVGGILLPLLGWLMVWREERETRWY